MKNSNKENTEKPLSFYIKINMFRRKLMSSLTRNIGKTNIKALSQDPNSPQLEIKKVLIVRPNHRLGNLVLISSLVQEVIATFPKCEIHIIGRGFLAPILFQNYGEVKKYYLLPKKPFNNLFSYLFTWIKVKFQRYDLTINVTKGSSSGKLLTLWSNSKLKIYDEVDEQYVSTEPESFHMGKNPVYNLRNYLSKIGIKHSNNEIPQLSIKLDSNEILKGQKELMQLFNNEQQTICIYTHASGTKCYSKKYWHSLYGQLKETFNTYNILEVLPKENISQIDFKATSYYSNDIRELAAVIENTALFVSADCGVMHLASATNTPVIGLFSVTDLKKYKPYNPGSIAINTNKTSVDKIINKCKGILKD